MKTTMVTEHAEFYRAQGDEGTRYYPAKGAGMREQAIAFDKSSNPDKVGGFGVYDTAVSATYAVGLYASKAEAEKHLPVDPPAAPTAIIEDEPVSGDFEQELADIPAEDEESPSTIGRKSAKNRRAKPSGG